MGGGTQRNEAGTEPEAPFSWLGCLLPAGRCQRRTVEAIIPTCHAKCDLWGNRDMDRYLNRFKAAEENS